jgi:rare lipoprotein A
LDSLKTNENLKLKVFKKKAHASYYARKFNGKRTASGKRFDNDKYTAAHRKFPFGTKLKITNEANGKSVIVEVIDRGPFSRGREIDLTKRAFMEIASNKNSGSAIVTIELVVD